MEQVIQSVVAPLSGVTFQWRSDGKWRTVSPQQMQDEVAGRFSPLEDEWRSPDNDQSLFSGSAEGWNLGRPSWWLLYNWTPPTGPPLVMLPDHSQPPVVVLCGIWFCEWSSSGSGATVVIDGKRHEAFSHYPHYLDAQDQTPEASRWIGYGPPKR